MSSCRVSSRPWSQVSVLRSWGAMWAVWVMSALRTWGGLPAMGQVDQVNVSGGALDQGADRRALPTTDDEVTFPMPWRLPVVDLRGALVDQCHVLDLVQGGDAAALLLATGSTSAELGVASAEEAGEQGPVDRLRTRPHRCVVGVLAGQVTRDLLG